MKELPVKIQVIASEYGMVGKFGVVCVIEGFEEEAEAQDHAKYLGPILVNAGIYKNEVQAQIAAAEEAQKKVVKKKRHIQLLTD